MEPAADRSASAARWLERSAALSPHRPAIARFFGESSEWPLASALCRIIDLRMAAP